MRFPPGPPAHRNPLELIRYFRDISADPIAFVKGRFDTYGDIYYAQVRGTGLYVIRHPDHLDEVLRTKGRFFQKTTEGFAAARLHELLGNGLVNANGEHWRRHRRMINPALSRKRIQSYAPTFVDFTAREVDTWRVGQVIDMSKAITGLTLRIVTKVLFDHDSGAYVDRVAEAMDAFREAQGLGAALPKWVPYPPNRRWDEALEAVDEIIYEMIEEKRRAKTTGDDLLSSLLQASDDEGDGAGLTATELRDELLTLFFAGHETTSNALVWTLYLLSQNPEVEEWVCQELADFGDVALGVEHLDQLPRCRAAIDEAMRVFPPVAVISRTATEDVQIGDYDVTAGSEVLLWFYWTHHDERWFTDAETYCPQRFLDAPSWPKPAYMPFGGGQRSCIGKHFALMESTLILATLLQRFRLEYVGDVPPKPQLAVTLAPADGLRMRVQPRP